MKKLMSILTACLFVFTLACCSGDKDSGSSASDGSGTSSVSSSSSSSDNKGASTVNKASEEEEEDNQTFTLNSKTPENVVNAIFYAARTQDFQILGELCDPEGEGDDDSKSLCALGRNEIHQGSEHQITRENFVEVFKNGKISGVTTKRDGGAKVPILFGPDGDKEETMKLFKRDGKWYLYSF